jgi:hypothetical protein
MQIFDDVVDVLTVEVVLEGGIMPLRPPKMVERTWASVAGAPLGRDGR